MAQAKAQQALAEALEHEQTIADEAAAIRNGAATLTPDLLVRLLPLLRRPIPDGFITHIGVVKGKPYESTGIKSVQVQIDRMDNVLTPLAWNHDVVYTEGGKLAQVIVRVLDGTGKALFSRESWGGVNQASTTGNLYKGSYTNAAKRAFAMVGPGHEVYLGATDLDPDVSEDAAKAQEQPAAAAAPPRPLSDESRAKVLKAFADAGVGGEDLHMFFAAAGITLPEEMTAAHAHKLRELLDEHLARKSEPAAPAPEQGQLA